MKKVILLILASVAVYGNNIKECLGGDIKACEEVADMTFINVRLALQPESILSIIEKAK